MYMGDDSVSVWTVTEPTSVHRQKVLLRSSVLVFDHKMLLVASRGKVARPLVSLLTLIRPLVLPYLVLPYLTG